ncbi:MAG TPA: hypothetical protein VF037_04685 [Gemmatimonadales bacterium]
MKPPIRLTLIAGIAMAAPTAAQAQDAAHAHAPAARASSIGIPADMKAEHDAIHGRLVAATTLPGRTGEAARALARVLHPHFVREEEIALPPLGLLEPLGRGEFTPDMAAVLAMTDALREELPRMLEEHAAVRRATMHLGEMARSEGQADAAELAVELAAHARADEQIFYPAAILVGEVVRNRAAAQER